MPLSKKQRFFSPFFSFEFFIYAIKSTKLTYKTIYDMCSFALQPADGEGQPCEGSLEGSGKRPFVGKGGKNYSSGGRGAADVNARTSY